MKLREITEYHPELKKLAEDFLEIYEELNRRLDSCLPKAWKRLREGWYLIPVEKYGSGDAETHSDARIALTPLLRAMGWEVADWKAGIARATDDPRLVGPPRQKEIRIGKLLAQAERLAARAQKEGLDNIVHETVERMIRAHIPIDPVFVKDQLARVFAHGPGAITRLRRAFENDPTRSTAAKSRTGGETVTVLTVDPLEVAHASTYRGWTSCRDVLYYHDPDLAREALCSDLEAGVVGLWLTDQHDAHRLDKPIARVSLMAYLGPDGGITLRPLESTDTKPRVYGSAPTWWVESIGKIILTIERNCARTAGVYRAHNVPKFIFGNVEREIVLPDEFSLMPDMETAESFMRNYKSILGSVTGIDNPSKYLRDLIVRRIYRGGEKWRNIRTLARLARSLPDDDPSVAPLKLALDPCLIRTPADLKVLMSAATDSNIRRILELTTNDDNVLDCIISAARHPDQFRDTPVHIIGIRWDRLIDASEKLLKRACKTRNRRLADTIGTFLGGKEGLKYWEFLALFNAMIRIGKNDLECVRWFVANVDTRGSDCLEALREAVRDGTSKSLRKLMDTCPNLGNDGRAFVARLVVADPVADLVDMIRHSVDDRTVWNAVLENLDSSQRARVLRGVLEWAASGPTRRKARSVIDALANLGSGMLRTAASVLAAALAAPEGIRLPTDFDDILRTPDGTRLLRLMADVFEHDRSAVLALAPGLRVDAVEEYLGAARDPERAVRIAKLPDLWASRGGRLGALRRLIFKAEQGASESSVETEVQDALAAGIRRSVVEPLRKAAAERWKWRLASKRSTS